MNLNARERFTSPSKNSCTPRLSQKRPAQNISLSSDMPDFYISNILLLTRVVLVAK